MVSRWSFTFDNVFAHSNSGFDFSGSIRVFCRVRPFLLSDRRRIHEPISTGLEKVVVKSVGIRKEYRYDKVFHQAAAQGWCPN